MKKILIVILILILVALGAYAYITRPVSAPSQDINDVSQKLPAGSEVSNIYRISDEKSVVEFSINELLRNVPTLVVGTTTEIAGDIRVKDNAIEIGTIKINARTFVIDNKSRNGAINRLILKSEDPANEFITFVPEQNDFAGTIEEGKTITFNVPGNITIAGVTKPISFKVNMTMTRDLVTGIAETTIQRGGFGLVIPSLPFIADVDEEVPIKATIVADRIMQ